MDSITPRTAYEMQILEFVKLADVDPIYFETSYYVAPDRAGERACGLLFEALRKSGFVAVAQVAMHRREHVVIIRPGRTGIILHTMFYETEIRREEECRTDVSTICQKELELALLLVNNLAAPFEPSKYRDAYRDKLDKLIAAKMQNLAIAADQHPNRAPVVNILDALKRSLRSNSKGVREPNKAESPKSRARRPRQRNTNAPQT
jgi:DNA end-binding protein Ku